LVSDAAASTVGPDPVDAGAEVVAAAALELVVPAALVEVLLLLLPHPARATAPITDPAANARFELTTRPPPLLRRDRIRARY
jgi:hypothetical protein